MAFAVFLALVSKENNKLNAENEKIGIELFQYQELETKYQELEGQLERKEEEIADLRGRINDVERARQEESNSCAAPFIVLDDAQGGHFFATNSAKIDPGFSAFIRGELRRTLEQLLVDFPETNAIYIIGHTDHRRVNRANRNFEQQAVNLFHGRLSNWSIHCNSNAELGLLRAFAVMKELKQSSIGRGSIKHWQAYSGGPFTNLDGEIVRELNNKDIPALRRIEIRLMSISEEAIQQ
ncbi:MAG: hypothetical protein AAF433_09485 [Bacteroidota bacterium]